MSIAAANQRKLECCYAIAAARGGDPNDVRPRVWGDGLVPQRSALGEHVDPSRALPFPPDHRWVAERAGHIDLSDRADVYARIREWVRD